MFVLMNDIFGK